MPSVFLSSSLLPTNDDRHDDSEGGKIYKGQQHQRLNTPDTRSCSTDRQHLQQPPTRTVDAEDEEESTTTRGEQKKKFVVTGVGDPGKKTSPSKRDDKDSVGERGFSDDEVRQRQHPSPYRPQHSSSIPGGVGVVSLSADDQANWDQHLKPRLALQKDIKAPKSVHLTHSRILLREASVDSRTTESTSAEESYEDYCLEDTSTVFYFADDDNSFPLLELENVTHLSRSLITPEQLKSRPPRRRRRFTPSLKSSNMATVTKQQQQQQNQKKSGGWGKRLSLSRSRTRGASDNDSTAADTKRVNGQSTGSSSAARKSTSAPRATAPSKARETKSNNSGTSTTKAAANKSAALKREDSAQGSSGSFNNEPQRRGVLQRLRSVSRSRSRSRDTSAGYNSSSDSSNANKPILVAVTSCRSDAYYNQKAPGSTTKLPRKAPSNLKLFHELAIGIKDAYAAVGQTPKRPEPDENADGKMTEQEMEGRRVLWDFVSNLDFLLALVDEVAVDTATRGALKDDSTFKSLRDVIKKCNKVLEEMLVRRERRFTLFFRLVQPTETREIAKIRSWNAKVEKAVGAVADNPSGMTSASDSETDDQSASSVSGAGGNNMFSRGRQLLPAAGRTRMRRATPTPKLRQHRAQDDEPSSSAAEDGFAASTPALTKGNLALQQRSLKDDPDVNKVTGMPQVLTPAAAAPTPPPTLQPEKPVQAKEELIDVIRGLRTEQKAKRDGTAESDLATLKPNWQPKADIPSSVPKLPTEYIHRHRLMKQVVSRLLEKPGQSSDDEDPSNTIITCITSRHADKPGNGKTTLAVAAIQTVEVRERFSDGIAWIQLGRTPLTEKEVRRLYEELFRQLVNKDEPADDIDDAADDIGTDKPDQVKDKGAATGKGKGARERQEHAVRIAESRQRFQGGELEAIKEDLARIITTRKILICLDDVWRVDDAKWFIFDSRLSGQAKRGKRDDDPYRILVTTRTPSLFGAGVVAEVFVRIFSEHEAVKLLLSSAGRRPYGGKASAVFNQARVIVKGCGNSPLAVRLAGGMLRRSNRNWNIVSPTWKSLIQQCRLNLEEASRLRSFVNSVHRVVDLSFASVDELNLRVTLRRCFVSFAMCFRDNDWCHVGRGIPEPVLLKIFAMIIQSEQTDKNVRSDLTASDVMVTLETMNLLHQARHGVTHPYSDIDPKSSDDDRDDMGETKDDDLLLGGQVPSYVMHDSIRAIGEDVANRNEAGFLPIVDEYTSFGEEIRGEKSFQEARAGGIWSDPLKFIARHLNQEDNGNQIDEAQIHELVVACLLDVKGTVDNASMTEAFNRSRPMSFSRGGVKMEHYLTTFLPVHMMRAKAFVAAGDLMISRVFVRRRVAALGITEASRRHIADLLELRREVAKLASSNGKSAPSTPKRAKSEKSPQSTPGSSTPEVTGSEANESVENMDTSAIMRDGARAIVDEVHEVVSATKGTTETLGMAMCLATVGEGLLKGKQPRDAMLRLEEAVIIFRGLLGQNNVDVARSLHSVARALVKLGENRVALRKFTEAAEIYEACEATMHYDSIANGLNLATLLVDLGEWDRANAQYEDVIERKKRVYGDGSVSVAKTINSYAIVLAKHSRMDEALLNYIAAKETYEAVPKSLLQDPEFDVKCKYDVTLINLNIASIRSKKGDVKGAIASYEDGVRGLREYAEVQEALASKPGADESTKSNSHVKHLVAALGRIGSLKLKLGDNEGALKAYEALLDEVKDDSPQVSRVEKAKAHIKCATIFRQVDGREAHERSIQHLRSALDMYTVLFGAEHKDTLAIASSLKQWVSEEQDNLHDSSNSIPKHYND